MSDFSLTLLLQIKTSKIIISGETAFGDASIADVESDSRHLYALRLVKFNALRCKISDDSRLYRQNINV